MRRGFKTWAENSALDQRHVLGLGAEAPLPARVLAEHLDVVVVGPEDIPGVTSDILRHLLTNDIESWSATTIARSGCTVIIHNTAHSPRRQESNLMHELAHVLCAHQPSQLVMSGNLPFVLRSFNADQEEEAKWLGGCLQLPRTALLWAIQCGMNDLMIVEHYNASASLVKYRRQVTGVDMQLRRRARI